MNGDYNLGDTLDFKFTTRAFATGIPTTLAGSPAIEIYEDNSTTQITAGITLTVDFDSVTGLNNLRVVASSGNGFGAGQSYAAVISAGTVAGVSVVGEVVAQFTINRHPALRPTTAGRTLTVESGGGTDVARWAGDASVPTRIGLASIPIVDSTATATTLSTTQMSTNLTETTDDHYTNRHVMWTDGDLQGQARKITAYNGTTKTLTFETATEAPGSGDGFIIV